MSHFTVRLSWGEEPDKEVKVMHFGKDFDVSTGEWHNGVLHPSSQPVASLCFHFKDREAAQQFMTTLNMTWDSAVRP